MIMKNNLLMSAIAVAATAAIFAGSAYAADVTTDGNLNTVDRWYGRAGGAVGTDRVNRLSAGTTVGVSHDADVAARTNMPRREGSNSSLGVTYDADVAARTNMLPREATAAHVQAEPLVGPKSN
jgi:hypothetical protein